jgi:hypothetical protein
MRRFGLKKKSVGEAMWTLSALKSPNGDVTGTHLLMQGARWNEREYSYVMFVTLSYEGGHMPSTEVMHRFDEFEEKLADCLVRCPGLNVGVFMHRGNRDWICYVKDGQAAANLVYSELSSYSPKILVKYDPKWSEYRSFADMSKG